MFLVDQYAAELRPATPELTESLTQNLLIVGGPCSGKKMLAQKILVERYGPSVSKLQEHEHLVNHYGSKTASRSPGRPHSTYSAPVGSAARPEGPEAGHPSFLRFRWSSR
jgi:hypothetical protein